MSESDQLEREALRCWEEGLGEINKGKARMERAYSLREKAFKLRIKDAIMEGAIYAEHYVE